MGVFDKVEAVGWKFFGTCAVVFAAPGAALGWYLTNESMTPYGRIMSGIITGVIAAAVFTTVVNELLHRRNVRRHLASQQAEAKPGKRAK